MEKSAGLAITRNKKILLVHPARSPWRETFSIPKGHIEEGETPLDAAIRETYEEIGLRISPSDIKSGPEEILYKRGSKTYKKVYWFWVDATHLDIPEIISKDHLQMDEVDWAGFVTYPDAVSKIFWRFTPLLDLIK